LILFNSKFFELKWFAHLWWGVFSVEFLVFSVALFYSKLTTQNASLFL